MKILTTLHQIHHLEQVISLADGIIIGHEKFGARLTSHFEVNQINQIISSTKKLQKEVFLQANQMMTDDQLNQFEIFD
jgi:collagenase-like PrtC family protease